MPVPRRHWGIFFADAADMSPRLRIIDPDGGFGLEIGNCFFFCRSVPNIQRKI